jgi:two-component system nitrate/nitrite response regulator NarL
VSSPRTPHLSEREVQVLNGLVKGHANKVIARTCDIAESTVKVHIKSILRKIRLSNRTQAAIWALGNGYTEPRDHSTNLAATANQIDTPLAA